MIHFFFRHRTNRIVPGFFQGFTDYHSHILPRVDDGIRTMEEAFDTLNYFERLGVAKIIFTPHVMNGAMDWKNIVDSFEAFRSQYQGTLDTSLGAGYLLKQGMYDLAGTDLHNLNLFRTRVEALEITREHNQMLLRLREKQTTPSL